MSDPRRALPSVDRLLQRPAVQALLARVPRTVVVDAARESLDAARQRDGTPPDDWDADLLARVERRIRPSLEPALNATGVVLHTNLGRAPLARAAVDAAAAVAAGYATLEIDLAAGGRGSRAAHCRALLAGLAGAEDALAVNNAAGALVLALRALAAGADVLLSRGEMIEIGGSFRIPEIMEQSGARMAEVGTTNRTRLEDYRRGLDRGAAAVLTVHQSNFTQQGFVAGVPPAELAALCHERGVPYLYDVGSGLLADLAPFGLAGEPRVPDAVAAGADLVIFSGDKLLGGPQAGCLAGRSDLIARCRTSPLARALRADKMTLAALEATLRLYQDPEAARREIPVLAMLTLGEEELRRRAALLLAQCPPGFEPTTIPGQSAVGGGAFPTAALPTTLVALRAPDGDADRLARRLRTGSPPLIARIERDRILLDPRTLPEQRFPEIGRLLHGAMTGP